MAFQTSNQRSSNAFVKLTFKSGYGTQMTSLLHGSVANSPDPLGGARGTGLFRIASEPEGVRLRDFLGLAAALQGLTYATMDGGFAISVIVHSVLGIGMIEACAPESVQDLYLDDLRSGRKILAFAVTEEHSGTDAFRPQTIVSRTSHDSWCIKGRKWHITNAPFADVMIVLARETDSGNLVEAVIDRKTPGVSVSPQFNIAGARTSPVAEIILDKVVVPSVNVFRPIVEGRNQLVQLLNREKAVGASASTGVIERVVTDSLRFTRERKVNGKSLASHQHVQRRLTDLQLALETTRALSESTMSRLVAGDDATLQASALKLYMAANAFSAATNAVLSLGSAGIQVESRLPMALMDALAVMIGGGTEEAQRSLMFSEMIKAQVSMEKQVSSGRPR